jgi:hypothetical protein
MFSPIGVASIATSTRFLISLGSLTGCHVHIHISRTVPRNANTVTLLKRALLYLPMHLCLFAFGVMLLPPPVFSLTDFVLVCCI